MHHHKHAPKVNTVQQEAEVLDVRAEDAMERRRMQESHAQSEGRVGAASCLDAGG